jgi:hypothetical protein
MLSSSVTLALLFSTTDAKIPASGLSKWNYFLTQLTKHDLLPHHFLKAETVQQTTSNPRYFGQV